MPDCNKSDQRHSGIANCFDRGVPLPRSIDIGPGLQAEWQKIVRGLESSFGSEVAAKLLRFQTADGVPLRNGMTIYQRVVDHHRLQEMEPWEVVLDAAVHEIESVQTVTGAEIGLCLKRSTCPMGMGPLACWYSSKEAIRKDRIRELLEARDEIDKNSRRRATATGRPRGGRGRRDLNRRQCPGGRGADARLRL